MGAQWEYMRSVRPKLNMSIERFFMLDAGIVLITALLLATFFSLRKARQKDLPIWNKTAQYVMISMAIPLIAGGLFCLIQASQGIYRWISATTLLFYGMALLNASKYTLKEVQLLGLSQMLVGLVCAMLPGYGLYFWALGFGLLHIIYGIVMYLKYDR